MKSCDICNPCQDYEQYLDEMVNILSAKGILSTQYIIQLVHLYRAFINKYYIGSNFVSLDGSINARVDQYRLVRDTGHVKVYLLDGDDNLLEYLIEDLVKLVTPEGEENRLSAAYLSYMRDHYKMMSLMERINIEEQEFNSQLILMYPKGTEVGVYLEKVKVLDYLGQNSGVVKIQLKNDEILYLTTSDFYQGITEYKTNFRKDLVGGNY